MIRILVCIPMRPNMLPALKLESLAMASRMIASKSNPDIELSLFIDQSDEPRAPDDVTPWRKVSRVRNKLLSRINYSAYDYLLWIDSDIISYPEEMPTLLVRGNPGGVSAPSVMIEHSDLFYDWSAFILKGRSDIEPDRWAIIPGRNVNNHPPHWPDGMETGVIEMDCVGAITLVPTWAYKMAVYEDHPAFTDHFSICKAVRTAGASVVCNRDVVALHAHMTDRGDSWNLFKE